MIELRWLETESHVKDGECFAQPVKVQTLQYRQHEMVGQGVDMFGHAYTTTKLSEWKTVPTVTEQERGQ